MSAGERFGPYRKRRDFAKTPEPRGELASGDEGESLFVVQQHDARRMHFDFRLAIGGVLKSWAVPRGPSLDPKEKRLAVETEDHPLEYGGFEGVIPEGEYGAGPVILWDRGRWEAVGDAAAGYRSGHLRIRLHGDKLRGGWSLMRMGRAAPGGRRNWLLLKERDEAARSPGEIVAERPESVLSGRCVADLGRHRGAGLRWARPVDEAGGDGETAAWRTELRRRLTRLGGVRSARMPTEMAPELATLVGELPYGPDWLYEVKLDGYRLLCFIDHGRVQWRTRYGHDWTERFPSLARAASMLPVETAILDGEIVALRDDGVTSFQALQETVAQGSDAGLLAFMFDLLYLDGISLLGVGLLERKRLLGLLLSSAPGDGALRYAEHLAGDAAPLLAEACRLGLEGLVAKRARAPYVSGRTKDWLKMKCKRRQEFIIAGFSEHGDRSGCVGALVLSLEESGRLRFAGKVGTGWSDAAARRLHERLDEIRQDRSPLAERPAGLEGTVWVKPVLAAEVEFSEWTRDGVLRHPSFIGLREDRPPRVVREVPLVEQPPSQPSSRRGASLPATIAGVRLTNPDRVLYRAQGLTKRDIARYYESIAEFIMPHVAHRLITVVRCPEGHERDCFYQKHAARPVGEGIERIDVAEEDGRGTYLMVRSLAGLISLVQLGVLEIHVWGSRVDRLEQPDRLVMDLDPAPELGWHHVIAAARTVRLRLADLGLESLVKTTGGKGLHVVAPLVRRSGWEETKVFAEALAASIVGDEPERYTTSLAKVRRQGKIFIDYLRNVRGATAVAAYSTRARRGAPVSTPLAWDEIDAMHPQELSVTTVPERLHRLGDVWPRMWSLRQGITARAWRQLGRRPPR